MSELTPIPAEHRAAYYDALLAGRAEAERLGHGLIDDRIFAAFHRALYRPTLDAHEAEVRAKVAGEIDAEGERLLTIARRAVSLSNVTHALGFRDAADWLKQGHATNGPSVAVEPRTAPPESVRTHEGHGDVQEAVG